MKNRIESFGKTKVTEMTRKLSNPLLSAMK
jgi:hypothetical protein